MRQSAAALPALFILAVVTALLAIGHGAMVIGWEEIIRSLFTTKLDTAGINAVVLHIRLPRVVMGFLVGAVLATSGCITQALFRNPLADPGLIGVTSGAALGAGATIVLIGNVTLPFLGLTPYLIPLAAFAGGFITTFAVLLISRQNAQTSFATVLLAGIAINALVGALMGLLIYAASEEELKTLTFWTLGSLSGATWSTAAIAAPFLCLALFVAPFLAGPLNAIVLGDEEAFHLGVSVESVKMVAIAVVALGVGAAVAVSGMIGFVGIAVPHVLRLLLGPDHRFLLPGSALAGATLLLAADAAARTLVSPAEIPIGILTAILGAPVFLWILVQRKRKGGLL